jgi:putative sigma-54 modulation protein
MQIEYTGRHVHVNQACRALCEEGLERVSKLLGRILSAHVVLSNEKHRCMAEITIEIRANKLVSTAESTSMEAAVRMALEKAETQAKRFKQKMVTKKRLPNEEKVIIEPELTRTRRSTAVKRSADRKAAEAPVGATVNGTASTKKSTPGKPVVPVMVHSFPPKTPVIEPHVVRSLDSVAMRPMTLEEAVKEAEFRDREVFVFRNNKGIVCVLHRKRDGKMELIEAP